MRNFKILFIKGENLLFRNPNLLFQINDEKDILDRQQDFINEVAGVKPCSVMMILSENQMRSYVNTSFKN